jgi:hypothetical protein|nr:MAG TPA: PGDYG protein [Caudoviricetes sp.]
MAKIYVKKANKIEAIQYNGTNVMEIVDFIGDVIGIDWYENASLEITTDNETIECFKGDYVVKDHKDKIKVYEANEFEKNYSEVEDD